MMTWKRSSNNGRHRPTRNTQMPATWVGPSAKAAVLWMERQCYRFRFHSDTLCLSVALLDAFLGQVKAKAKYITCMALTCLYLAAKICEEDELVPAISYVVERARPGCSVADVLRMERVVLDKFGWQVRLVTPLNFLHSLHCLLVAACPGLLADRQHRLSAHRQLCGLTERLVELVTDVRTLGVPPSCLAAALICCELRRCNVDTAPFAQAAHRLIKRSPEEVSAAAEQVRAVLGDAGDSVLVPRPAVAAAKRPRQRGDSRSFSRPAKRKLVTAELDDDIVGDIRNLYKGAEEEAPRRPAAAPAGFQPPYSPEFPELGKQGHVAESPMSQTCGLISQVARLSYAEVLRRHLPIPSVMAGGI
ncbi:cyclin-I-like [Pollicipes pollicipes]|uniref:cyclin-I-like n=1 Tax=Pollicipes pollicipes TaxID=41117 RepID=UPI00188599D8|nr:cyclin-I-like [Pollicipes pollicipes]